MCCCGDCVEGVREVEDGEGVFLFWDGEFLAGGCVELFVCDVPQEIELCEECADDGGDFCL